MTSTKTYSKNHWENIYSSKPVEELGWYEPELQISLSWITGLQPDKHTSIIDIGGGASTLVDSLLKEGLENLTVLDISEEALDKTKSRLGDKAEKVDWIAGDMTTAELPADSYYIWHDRAVFHFLTSEEEREKYLTNLRRALQPGGKVIMATFAPEAPAKCSGLPVERYTPETIQETLGEEFNPEQTLKDLHVTPSGVEQMYLYTRFTYNP